MKRKTHAATAAACENQDSLSTELNNSQAAGKNAVGGDIFFGEPLGFNQKSHHSNEF
ncbi:MAG: hypothetical protein ORN51_03355 [Akkermansiaceae bacterium]|nr:hypothetical protein [Akkermansiaceae bacterium]